MVTLYFNTDVSEKGSRPGMWIHNNLLLCEDSYRKKIIEFIDKEKECNLYNTSISVWFHNLKYKIKKCSRNYSQTRVKERKWEYYKIQNSIQRLSQNSRR